MKKLTGVCALLATFPVVLHAVQPAVSWNGSQAQFFTDNDGPFTSGFRFRADADLTVTSLGAFDYLGDGLATAHTVGIWSLNGGTPLATATVPAGSAASLLGAFRYTAIPGLTLSANTEYIIGASDYFGQVSDIYPFDPQGFSSAPGVTFLASRGTLSGAAGLVFPQFGDLLPAGAPLTANFQFVTVPEPSAITLLGIGAAAVAGRLRFRAERRKS
jgi:PEP-CTERM motif